MQLLWCPSCLAVLLHCVLDPTSLFAARQDQCWCELLVLRGGLVSCVKGSRARQCQLCWLTPASAPQLLQGCYL